MPRQDLHVDAAHGEIETTDNLTGQIIYTFTYLSEIPGRNNERYAHGEITVPPGFEKSYSPTSGIHVTIPYIPTYKELSVRFRIDLPNGATQYLLNPIDNSQWFNVYTVHDDVRQTIRLSEFGMLNENGNFNFIFGDGALLLYSGDATDFYIKASLAQNEVFLLKAMAGNLYQHPTTGVGLIEFLHGNFENAGLAAKLQSEFENDKMTIVNAYMDSTNGELLLEVKEKNG